MHLRKFLLFGSFFGLFFGLLLFAPQKVLAQTCPQQWIINDTTVNLNDTATLFTAPDSNNLPIAIQVTLSDLRVGDKYYFYTDSNGWNDFKQDETIIKNIQTFTFPSSGKITSGHAIEASNNVHRLQVVNLSSQSPGNVICVFHYKIVAVKRECPCTINISSSLDPENGKTLTPLTDITFSGRAFPDEECGKKASNWTWTLTVTNDKNSPYLVKLGVNGDYSVTPKDTYSSGTFFVSLQGGLQAHGVFAPSVICHNNFTIKPEGGDTGTGEEGTTAIKEICADVPSPAKEDECQPCFVAGKTWTALGCIPTNNLNDFVGWILGKVIFIATGIAFILLVIGALQILTSAGNPEKVKAGGELITSTITGLLLIILSLFLLKLIGVDILHLPGF